MMPSAVTTDTLNNLDVRSSFVSWLVSDVSSVAEKINMKIRHITGKHQNKTFIHNIINLILIILLLGVFF